MQIYYSPEGSSGNGKGINSKKGKSKFASVAPIEDKEKIYYPANKVGAKLLARSIKDLKENGFLEPGVSDLVANYSKFGISENSRLDDLVTYCGRLIIFELKDIDLGYELYRRHPEINEMAIQLSYLLPMIEKQKLEENGEIYRTAIQKSANIYAQVSSALVYINTDMDKVIKAKNHFLNQRLQDIADRFNKNAIHEMEVDGRPNPMWLALCNISNSAENEVIRAKVKICINELLDICGPVSSISSSEYELMMEKITKTIRPAVDEKFEPVLKTRDELLCYHPSFFDRIRKKTRTQELKDALDNAIESMEKITKEEVLNAFMAAIEEILLINKKIDKY